LKESRRLFFKEVKEHSHVKLTAVRRYLRPWAAAVGYQRGVSRIWFIDGFAGAGSYESGELGSPGLALEEAKLIKSQGRKYQLSCLMFERDDANFRQLKRLASGYYDVECLVQRGNFWDKMDVVRDLVGQDPCFLFVDPFGLGDLDFERLAVLCADLRQVDLMVNFVSPAARRLEAEHSSLVSRAVGGAGWTVETISQVFQERLGARARLTTASLPVAGTFGDLKYEMILGARHPRAFELWNDEIAIADVEILNTATAEEEARLVGDLSLMLITAVEGRKRVQRDRLIAELAVRHCGEAHSRVYRRAVAKLIADGTWLKEPGPIGTAWIRV
jgi:three-Cys-motif partner protein